ncbi:megakaryocyte-associated tyrosine-protein kinase [Capsaspora owczarzaki ATCC 30864]|uniref:TKL protein kinase n=1 Tax=Capsaspora owczarzaki (strain ATCC 30864) TaxID=595528 RepID=A0A0D2WUN3_CAPO3|nr:megakaryocyte-associated tyrosine-protein kinase [Capsaspora owczarzaki ATCC 30864]KJE96420.1 TKL protein kinase [Capsaspora owczarzaki ATCC 30864]|eukprot:XP_004344372.2 megakaryocyte-associated tyrosine-protein kinase [Capsaspora owczarzaki ATCC 30864]
MDLRATTVREPPLATVFRTTEYSGSVAKLQDDNNPVWEQYFTTSQVNNYPGSFKLELEFYDADFLSNQILGSIVQTYTAGSSAAYIPITVNNPFASAYWIKFAYRVICQANYYGPTCDTFCTTSTGNCSTCDLVSGACTACKSGYTGTPSCSTCATNYYPSGSGSCVYCIPNDGGYYTCSSTGTKVCTPGYTGASCNTLVSCPTAPAAPTNTTKSQCSSVSANSTCTYQCNTGYSISAGSPNITCSTTGAWAPTATTLRCVDTNECNNLNGGCNQTCLNTPGSYDCSCLTGYTKNGDGKGETGCLDNNECSSANGGCQHTCTNLPGSYACSCNSGYQLQPDAKSCININECTTGMHNCAANATCADTIGSFTCTCKAGFSGNGTHCDDVNECNGIPFPCSSDALCTNTPGNYSCACKPGFLGNGLECAADGRVAFDVSSRFLVVRRPESGTSTISLVVEAPVQVDATVQFSISSASLTAVSSAPLQFSSTVHQQTITLNLAASGSALAQETIDIQLASPVNMALDDHFNRSQIVIEASQSQFGTVGVSAGSRQISLSNVMANPEFSITLERFSAVSYASAVDITFSVTSTVASSTTFVATIPAGQQTFAVSITVPNMGTPTVPSTLTYTITAATAVTLGEATPIGYYGSSVVAVPEHDYPYGLFSIANTASSWPEPSSASLTITRARGSVGTVTVRVTPYAVAFNTSTGTPVATIDLDFASTPVDVEFTAGILTKNALVAILDDTIPELAEVFGVRLEIVSGGGAVDSTASNVLVTIAESDSPHGVLAFDAATLAVDEPASDSSVSITITRTAGLFGDVTFAWATSITGSDHNVNAQAGLDFVEGAGTVTLLQGHSSAVIQVVIRADSLPELDETFAVTLSSPTGGATLGAQSTITVTINKNDKPYGTIGFVTPTLTKSADGSARFLVTGGSTFTAEVARYFGTFGTVTGDATLQFTTPVTAADFNNQVVRTVSFAAGQTSQTSNSFNVVAAQAPVRLFDIVLSPSSGSLATLDADAPSVIPCAIEASNAVDGVVRFTSLTFIAQESAGVALVTVERTGSALGAVTFTYSVRTGTAGGEDFDASIQDAPVVIEAGAASTVISIAVDDDDIPELDETFTVLLTGITAGSAYLTYASVATVTIAANDDPNGWIEFAPSGNPLGDDVYTVREDTPSLNIPVLRNGGRFGAVDVTVVAGTNASIAPFTAFLNRDHPDEGVSLTSDLHVTSPLVVHFAAGQSTASGALVLTILKDNVLEGAKALYLALQDPTNGAQLDARNVIMVELRDGEDSAANSAAAAVPIAIGVVVGCAAVILLVVIVLRRRKRARHQNQLLKATESGYAVPMQTVTIPSKGDASEPLYATATATYSNSAASATSGSANYDTIDARRNPNEAIYDDAVPLSRIHTTPTAISNQLRNNLVLGETLGSGAFGVVVAGQLSLEFVPQDAIYLCAKRNQSTLAVAVKQLAADATANSREDFFEEAQMVCRFSHPNIVRALAALLERDPNMCILELMPYGDLRSVLRNSLKDNVYWSAAEMSFALQQVASGLAYLETQNFVHRDLAARNCLVGAGLSVKISDFGLSRALEEKDYYHMETNGRLPVKWMAPECLNFRRFSPHSDVWAYGVLAWEVYAYGATPYGNLAAGREVLAQVEAGLRPQKPESCPDAAYALLERCWDLIPTARPTASELQKFFAVGASEGAIRDIGAML